MQRFVHTLVTASAVFVASAFVMSPSAHARQCIWNKAGFELHVAWYRPTALQMVPGQPLPSLDELEKPLITGVFTLGNLRGSGMCNDSDEVLTAVISVLNAARGVHETGKVRVDRAQLLIANNNGRTRAEGNAVRALHSAAFESVNARPYVVTTPTTTHYLDVWGTVFEPAHGLGGPLK